MPLIVQGLEGLGDCLHQRACIRQLMERDEVWLSTPWPSVYHDLIAEGLHVVPSKTKLRTQSKNVEREVALFEGSVPQDAAVIRMGFRYSMTRRLGSPLAMMCEMTGTDFGRADFRMPVPHEWVSQARDVVGYPDKPILFFRPLTERAEYRTARRNPLHRAYARLFEAVRGQFFVISVADLEPGAEWLVGERVEADLEFHAGELPFTALAGLMWLSSLCYTAPGFAVILAQAVGTPVATVFGGFENSSSFAPGGRLSPYLGIDPILPCSDWHHEFSWPKEIDIAHEWQRLRAFVAEHCQGEVR